MVNADNINYIENSNNKESWENSILFMNDSSVIYTVESQFELKELINTANNSV